MGFKEDTVFARYLTMGAYAAEAVARDLEQRGHRIIELERYAKANKIWGIKVKRLRLPDLLCVTCGRRFESKGKSKLEIKLSHSNTAGREWFGGGMRPGDVFAFVRVALSDAGADVGMPIYITRQALHDAEQSLIAGGRKAFSAGSEADVSWPAWAPSYAGIVVSADDQPLFGDSGDGAIKVDKTTGGVATYRGGAKWPVMHLYRKPGESFVAGDLVAGCVEPADVDCPGPVWNWENDLNAGGQDDRYAAVKAARFLDVTAAEPHLRALIEDEEEDWRIRLEALASLAASAAEPWVDAIRRKATTVTARNEEQMEAVFVLTEINHPEATKGLISVAQPAEGRKAEIRAAAVWGLGLGARPRPSAVVKFLDDPEDIVALHAAAALPENLPDDMRHLLVSWLRSGHERQAPIAAHVLAAHSCIEDLVETASLRGTFGGLLALRALGDLSPRFIEDTLTGLDDNIRKMLLPIWIQHDDWLRTPENDGGIHVLEQQRVRF